MNEELINDLAHIVNEEVRTFHGLLDVLRSEQRAIVEDDIEEIERCVEAQREVAVIAHELEGKRMRGAWPPLAHPTSPPSARTGVGASQLIPPSAG